MTTLTTPSLGTYSLSKSKWSQRHHVEYSIRSQFTISVSVNSCQMVIYSRFSLRQNNNIIIEKRMYSIHYDAISLPSSYRAMHSHLGRCILMCRAPHYETKLSNKKNTLKRNSQSQLRCNARRSSFIWTLWYSHGQYSLCVYLSFQIATAKK